METDTGRREMNLHNEISTMINLRETLEEMETNYAYIEGFSQGIDGLITSLDDNLASLEDEVRRLKAND